jgi:mono/diheme cytochrome c family protein
VLRGGAGFLLSLLLLVGGCSHRAGNARESLSSEVTADVPTWIRAEALPASARPGATLLATAGCTSCHTYLGAGSANLNAPDLTAEGLRHRGLAWQVDHLRCPSCVVSGSPMPRFASLGPLRLQQLAVFLESSKGKR